MWYYRALHRHVFHRLDAELPSAAQVLDAGCGAGGFLRRTHPLRPDWQLTGMDVSPLACELARQRTKAEIVQGSIVALPFAGATFEAVISCDVLCQVSDPLQGMREIYRCLKPGGVVVLTMPAYAWMYSYHDRSVGNLRRYTRDEVNALASGVGLAIRYSTYWNLLPFPLAVLRRKIVPPAPTASDVRQFPAPLEAFFGGLMGLEHLWFDLGGRLPGGNSVLTVAQKP